MTNRHCYRTPQNLYQFILDIIYSAHDLTTANERNGLLLYLLEFIGATSSHSFVFVLYFLQELKYSNPSNPPIMYISWSLTIVPWYALGPCGSSLNICVQRSDFVSYVSMIAVGLPPLQPPMANSTSNGYLGRASIGAMELDMFGANCRSYKNFKVSIM